MTARGKPAGYYYVADGRIGPAAWLEPSHDAAVLFHAMRDATEQSDRAHIVVPGMNHLGIAAALGAGLRLERSSHLF